MNMKYLIYLSIMLLLTVSIASAGFVTTHPHVGNTYWVGADGQEISLLNNKSATNPTYNKLISFIKKDKTDERVYKPDKFTCGDFAEVVHNNAEKVGIKAAWVSVDFYNDEWAHVCNAFYTTDKGLVYIDCTGSYPHKKGSCDSIVKIKIGKPYRPTELFKSGYTYNSMGIVKNFARYW
jgi:hypothetical protein